MFYYKYQYISRITRLKWFDDDIRKSHTYNGFNSKKKKNVWTKAAHFIHYIANYHALVDETAHYIFNNLLTTCQIT